MKSKTIKIGSLVACLLMIATIFAFVNPAQAAITKTVQVSSNQPWTDTGLTVSPGDVISITASGTVIFADPHTPEHTTGPDGKPGLSGGCSYVVTDPSVPRNSLIGNIADSSSLDGKGFFVGSSFQGAVPIPDTTKESGKLFLGFNDGVVYCDRSGYDAWGFGGDNHGSFTAIITIDSEKIVFASDRSGNWDIWMMNPDGTELEQLTTDPANDSGPALSPDGTKVAFASDREGNSDIYVFDLQTRMITPLTTDNPESDSDPTWSPDSSEIAFASGRGGYGAIWKISASGGTATQVTFPTLLTPAEGDLYPDWSPDGQHIIFMSTEGHRDLWAIWEVSSDGTGTEKKIIERFGGNEMAPAYSPEGTHIVWSHLNIPSCSGGGANIWIADSDGANRQEIFPSSSCNYNAHWSPNGMQIVFQSNRGGNWDIWVINTDGSGLTPLTSGGSSNSGPNWGFIKKYEIDEDLVEIGGKIYCLVKGDLLYYKEGKIGKIVGHIGMYSGNGKFVDAHPENNLTDPGTLLTGYKTINAVNENEIKGSRFDKSTTSCYSVKTTQAKRNAAVEWAKGKIGKNYNLWPPTPCDAGDEWYCSELVHCAYEAQGITLGEICPFGYVRPQSVISDSGVAIIYDDSIVAYVVSSDFSGKEQNRFELTEDVYCYARNLPASTDVRIYVVENKDVWNDGDGLTDVSGVLGFETVTTETDGSISTTLIWSSPLTQGSYDIVVDTNRNGEWNEGEPIDSWTTTGFEAIPEFTTIAIPVAAIIGLMFLFSRRKKKGRGLI